MSGERTAMCFVCGKKFPRGALDLARHTTAVTLMHLAARKPKPEYDYKCSKCDLYFKSEAHLDLHLQIVCSSSAMERISASPSVQSSKSNAQGGADDQADITTEPKGEEDKASECMVCGKLFPRGPIDLARHQTAITLRHLVHPRHTSTFHYGCKKCGLHFTTAEHLAMHVDQSTCNEDMVWPTTVTPGAKCVTRAEAAELERNESTASAVEVGAKAPSAATKEPKEVKETKAALKKLAYTIDSNPLPSKRLHKKSAVSEAAASNPSLSKYMLNKLALQQQLQQQQLSGAAGTKRARDGATPPGGSQLAVTDLYVPRQKRAKVIVPEDREAFFAVVSLLVDPSTVPEGVRLDEDNYEAYVPAQHRKLVDALRANLFCTC